MKVNEIFYSLQGEGRFTGTPAVFLRLSGCNLHCSFCDTDHFDGEEMSPGEILEHIAGFPSRHLVVTGGEPSLQLDAEFVGMLHEAGWFVQVETNGTSPLPSCVDWITCSPKNAPIVYTHVDELKVVYRGDGNDDTFIRRLNGVVAKVRYLQPCDVGDPQRNRRILHDCIAYIKANPAWKLSLQTHKIIDIR